MSVVQAALAAPSRSFSQDWIARKRTQLASNTAPPACASNSGCAPLLSPSVSQKSIFTIVNESDDQSSLDLDELAYLHKMGRKPHQEIVCNAINAHELTGDVAQLDIAIAALQHLQSLSNTAPPACAVQ